MYRNNINIAIFQRFLYPVIITDTEIPLRFFSPYINIKNAEFFLERDDLPLKMIDDIVGKGWFHAREYRILCSPSFNHEIFLHLYEKAKLYDKQNPLRRKYRYYYDAMNAVCRSCDWYDTPINIHNKTEFAEARTYLDYDKQTIYNCVKNTLPRCYMRGEILHIYFCEKLNTSAQEYANTALSDCFQYKRVKTRRWNYGKGYYFLSGDININIDCKLTFFKSLKHEIIELIKICFRFKIPQEILHMIAEYVLC